jgi:hypothetical protein
MKRRIAALALLVGLGTSVSSAQSRMNQLPSDPFDRYLKDVKTGVLEPSLQRFSAECNIDLPRSQPRFAINPGADWTLVRSLADGLRKVESDFYSTAEVWSAGNHVLVEIWPISADVGSEIRVFRCFADGRLLKAEAIDWNVPLIDSPGATGWGYSRRWERDSNGRMKQSKAEFVDESERVIPKPKLDVDGEKSLQWTPNLSSLTELKLPPRLLQ